MREALSQRIFYLRVCGPLPCRHQKEARCLPVCVVKRMQLQQCVFGCVLTLLPSGLAAPHSQVCLGRRYYACW